jgi:hypothetical protein
MARKIKNNKTPQVNPELQGFNIHINEFGEIISNIDIGRLNSFLDERVDDKKFRGIDVIKRTDDVIAKDSAEQ